jgi:hypothetical protein
MAFTRRHLPHWIPEESIIFVTWRLAGSLPSGVAGCQSSPKTDWLTNDTKRSSVPLSFLSQDERFDRTRCGPVWLQDSKVASLVVEALLHGETVRQFYELQAWAVMPNHVHAVFQPRTTMSTIMRWLKGRTGRVANRILGRVGTPFWQDESFDHWVRSAEELHYLTE